MINQLTIILLISYLPLIALAQRDEFRTIEISAKIKNEFTSKADDILTIQSSFKQEKYISYLGASVLSEGSFYYQKPNSIRWEYHSPYQYIIIIKDGVLKIYDTKEEMNFKQKENEFFDHLNILIKNSLTGDVFSENRYETSLMESRSKFNLMVVPRDEKTRAMIAKVEILFDKQNLKVESLLIHEVSGDNTSISFNNRKYNVNLDQKLFE